MGEKMWLTQFSNDFSKCIAHMNIYIHIDTQIELLQCPLITNITASWWHQLYVLGC